jgi:hypothetical protein
MWSWYRKFPELGSTGSQLQLRCSLSSWLVIFSQDHTEFTIVSPVSSRVLSSCWGLNNVLMTGWLTDGMNRWEPRSVKGQLNRKCSWTGNHTFNCILNQRMNQCVSLKREELNQACDLTEESRIEWEKQNERERKKTERERERERMRLKAQ